MPEQDPADDLLAFIHAAPTPWHAVEETVRRLEGAGFRPLDERERWTVAPGDQVFVTRGGSSVAAFESIAYATWSRAVYSGSVS